MKFQAESPTVDEDPVKDWVIDPDVEAKNRVIEEILKHLGERISMTPSTLFKYRLCLDEALTNSITHGSCAEVRVDFYCSESSWVVRILDQGPGFKESDLPDPTDPEAQFSESGRGLLIMDRYCEDLVYSRGGREVMLRMKLEEVTA